MNPTDPTSIIVGIYQMILPSIPAQYAGDITVISALVTSLCAVTTMIWGKPSDNSKLKPIYNIVNALAANVYKAKNADSNKGN